MDILISTDNIPELHSFALEELSHDIFGTLFGLYG
jgi:hypothetical protein